MRCIDELHMECPFAGSRMMEGLLRRKGATAGRLHVATCMKPMGIHALYRTPNTSKPAPGHKVHPYLLRKLAVTRANQVWAMDITHIPMARGFVYLVAVLDWFSRKVLAWRLSMTLETEPCVEALKKAMRRHGKPEIMNTDQGSQFTSIDFSKTLKDVASRSALMAKVRGETTSSLNGFGGRSNAKRSTRTHTRASRLHVTACAGIWPSTTAKDRIHQWSGGHPIRHISNSRHQSQWRRNRVGNPLTKRLETVQTSRTTSFNRPREFVRLKNVLHPPVGVNLDVGENSCKLKPPFRRKSSMCRSQCSV